MPWSVPFGEPIPVKGRTLFTLECAAKYIRKLSNAEQESQHWQAAISALIMAAEGKGPVLLARANIVRALGRNAEWVFHSSRKDRKRGRSTLHVGY